MRLIISLIVVLTLTAGAFYFIKYPNLFPTNEKNEQAPAPTPDPETYAVTVTEIQYHREKLALQYQNAGTQQERQQVIQSAKALLELTMPSSCAAGLVHLGILTVLHLNQVEAKSHAVILFLPSCVTPALKLSVSV